MHIVEEIEPSRMWPLDGPVAAMFVGGRTLREWQEATAPEAAVTLVANGWVASADWKLLLETEGEAKLESHDGEVLAWKGSAKAPGAAVVALASENSFVVKYPWDLLRVNELVVGSLTGGPGGSERVIESEHGLLIVGEDTQVLSGVFFEGTVVIGRAGKIGPNCYLRGSIAIGDHCHIGQAVEIKNSIIGHKTQVGHLSYVGDSVLGSRVNFGAGTIVGNLRHDGRNHRSMVEGELLETGRRKLGTIVGDAARTGIHTSIYPGRKLGPGALTRPAEVIERDKG